MTTEEREFAEQNHDLVMGFLRCKRLPMDDFYDVVIFGYLSAVQQNFRDPPSGVTFKTMAFRAMGALDSQLRTLKLLRAVPQGIYNFLLAKKDASSLDWLMSVLQALTFSNEASHLPGPIVTSNPDIWQNGFRRFTLLIATSPSLLRPILNELQAYDQQQKSGGQAALKLPTLPGVQ